MARGVKRTDPHRKGAIIPADYDHLISYSMPTSDHGFPIPGFAVNCELEFRNRETGELGKHGVPDENGMHFCCVLALTTSPGVKRAEFGSMGKCTACGAAFVAGDVYRHRASGEVIHLGHNCADKYAMVADRTDWTSKDEVFRAGIASQVLAKIRTDKIAKVYADNPGLDKALAHDHRISRDLLDKLNTYQELSPAQIALAFKLAAPPSADAEKTIPAPEGKQTFRGRVVSVKPAAGDYGGLKCTIKVTTDAGVWLAWGTLPKGVENDRIAECRATATQYGPALVKGREVEITATLKRGRDSHFAIMSRPNGLLIPEVKL